jgi:hypothetical protein
VGISTTHGIVGHCGGGAVVCFAGAQIVTAVCSVYEVVEYIETQRVVTLIELHQDKDTDRDRIEVMITNRLELQVRTRSRNARGGIGRGNRPVRTRRFGPPRDWTFN